MKIDLLNSMKIQEKRKISHNASQVKESGKWKRYSCPSVSVGRGRAGECLFSVELVTLLVFGSGLSFLNVIVLLWLAGFEPLLAVCRADHWLTEASSQRKIFKGKNKHLSKIRIQLCTLHMNGSILRLSILHADLNFSPRFHLYCAFFKLKQQLMVRRIEFCSS